MQLEMNIRDIYERRACKNSSVCLVDYVFIVSCVMGLDSPTDLSMLLLESMRFCQLGSLRNR